MSNKSKTNRWTIRHTFDLSDVTTTQELDIPCDRKNFKASLKYYPAGKEEHPDWVAAYLYISDQYSRAFCKDGRFIQANIQCGDTVNYITSRSITSYKNGWGSHQLFKKELVKKHKSITITIFIDDGFSAAQKIQQAHISNLTALYNAAIVSGDIKLIRIASEHEDEDDEKDLHVASIDGDDEEEERKCVRVPRLFLTSASEVFRNMLAIDMKESNERTIEIPCKSVQVVDDLVYFLITGCLRVSASPFDLVKLAHCYQITHLMHACMERMVENVTETDFVAVVKVFEEYHLTQDDTACGVYGRLLNYFHRNKTTLLSSIQNVNELPFCFKQWSDYADNINNYTK